MVKIAVVCNCSTENNRYYFTPSYLKNYGNCPHDLIIVHKNFDFINKDELINKEGNIIYINKILQDGSEIPNRGYGSYKYIFDKFKKDYDIFVFMQETCVIRRVNWIKDAIDILNFSDNIGFCASHIFNGNDLQFLSTKYPHETHMRAPGPLFIKTKYLKEISWDFNSDHEGEMITGNLLVEKTNCIGIQIGNKLNFAYDTLGNPPLIGMERAMNRSNFNQIAQLLEYTFFNEKKGIDNFSISEFYYFENMYNKLTENERNELNIIHPANHISKMNVFYDLQPFNNLIYGKSVMRAIELFPNNIIRKENAFILNIDNSNELTIDRNNIQSFPDIIRILETKLMNCLEIGGPTILFKENSSYPIYNLFNSIDNINLYELTDSFISIKSDNDNKLYRNIFNQLKEINKTYDIIVSSHVIEHMANPIAILNNYKKLLNNKSYILSILPNKTEFWDRVRPTTTIEHIIQDYINNTDEDDKTHEEENLIVNHPYKIDKNHSDKPNNISYEEMIKNNINYRLMHHHCFDINLCIQLHEYLNFKTIACFVPPNDKLQIIYFGYKTD